MIAVARCDRHRERLEITLDNLGRVLYRCPVCDGQKTATVDTLNDGVAINRGPEGWEGRPCIVCHQLFLPKNVNQQYCSRSCSLATITHRHFHATQEGITQTGP